MLYRSLAFLSDATDDDGSGMRNFMNYDRRWLDEPHVGDHVGRAIWSLGDVLTTAWVPASSSLRGGCSRRSSARSTNELPLRTAAYTALGLARLDLDRLEPEAQGAARALRRRCSSSLRRDRRRGLAAGSRTRSGTTTRVCRRR